MNGDCKKINRQNKTKKQKHIGLVCPDEPAGLKDSAEQAELRQVTAKCIQMEDTHTHL